MITEDYVSFEVAKLLKEKGFEGENRDWYNTEGFIEEVGVDDGIDPTAHEDIFDSLVPAPTLQMTMKWLREVHKIFILIQQHIDMSYEWYIYEDGTWKGCDRESHNNSYEQACEAAIKYCLENLIKRHKEDKQKDKVNEPFVIVTNCKTEKYFYAKNFSINLKTNPCLDVRVTITPKDLNDIVPVIGKCSLSDCITKKECIGDNEKLHIEVFDENNIKQDEYFIYNAWVQSINYETNIITLCCDYVN